MNTFGQNRARSTDDEGVGRLPAVAEPDRAEQRLNHGRPHQGAKGKESKMPQRVHAVVAQRGLAERGQVPQTQVGDPKRQRG